MYIHMSNQRLPHEEEIQRVRDVQESLDQDSIQRLWEDVPATNTLPANEHGKSAEDVVASSNEATEEKSSSSSSATDQEREEPVADEEKRAEKEQQITELDAAKKQQQQQEQQLVPTMSPEHVLLLQVLRRAKRQQDLIIEVQKNLRLLTNIQKDIERTKEQMKQLQSAAKDSQKQIIKIQSQVAAVERAQEKGFEKLGTQKRGGALLSVKGKVANNRRKGRKKLK
jgi:hypothetical protein